MINSDQCQPPADIGTASQAGFARTAGHRRIDEDGMAHRKFPVRFGEMADEFVPENLTRSGTNMLPGGYVQIAATDSRVRDVNRHPSGSGLGHRDRQHLHDLTAFPHQRTLLM